MDPISLPTLSLGAGNDSGVHELAADLAILQDAINTLAASAQNGASEQSVIDISQGLSGGFGLVSTATSPLTTFNNTSISFTEAWTLEDGQTSDAVDNAYMTWAPDDDPTLLWVKQPGWYSVYDTLALSAPAAGYVEFRPHGGGLNLRVASETVRVGEQNGDQVRTALWLPDTTVLEFVVYTETDAQSVIHAELSVVPMFTLA